MQPTYISISNLFGSETRHNGAGDLEMSYYSGCEFCDGQAGWHRDE